MAENLVLERLQRFLAAHPELAPRVEQFLDELESPFSASRISTGGPVSLQPAPDSRPSGDPFVVGLGEVASVRISPVDGLHVHWPQPEVQSIKSAEITPSAGAGNFVSSETLARPQELAEGYRLGPYTILRKLGVGRTSTVYEARDTLSILFYRRVAVKVFHQPRRDDESWREEMRQHVELWSGFRDPRIVAIEDIREAGGIVFLVAEYMDGGTLLDHFAGLDMALRLRRLMPVLAFLERVLEHRGVSLDGHDILIGGQVVRLAVGRAPSNPILAVGRLTRQLLAGQAEPNTDAHRHLPLGYAWVADLISRCEPDAPGEFKTLEDLREFLRFVLDAQRADHVRIFARVHSGGIDYTIESRNASPWHASASVNQTTLRDIARRWVELGNLERNGTSSALTEKERRKFNSISELVLGRGLTQWLRRERPCSLTLVYDRALSGVPWEAMVAGGRPLAQGFAMSRIPILRTVRPDRTFARTSPTTATLIFDPQLKESREEARQLGALFKRQGLECEVVSVREGAMGVRVAVSGCDILHCATHGIRPQDLCEKSGTGPYLGPEDVLSSKELADLWSDRPPLLVFANSCYLAQVDEDAAWNRDVADEAVGFGHAVLAAGARNFAGTPIPVPDHSRTLRFASVFYEHFLAGRNISQAMQLARQDSLCEQTAGDLTPYRYVLLGDPFTVFANSAPNRSNLTL